MISFDNVISNKEVNRIKNYFHTVFNVYHYNKAYMPTSGSLVNKLDGFKTIQRNKTHDAYSILTCHHSIQDILKKIHSKVNEIHPFAKGTNIFLKFFAVENDYYNTGNAPQYHYQHVISNNFAFEDIYIIAPVISCFAKVKTKNDNHITNYCLKKGNLYVFKDEIIHIIDSVSIGLIITYTEKPIPILQQKVKMNSENIDNQFSTFNHTTQSTHGIIEVDVNSIFLNLENI